MKKIIFLSLFLAFPAAAAVPNRITYQGRLMQSGVTVTGPHNFIVCFVSGGVSVCNAQQSVALPVSGDFTLLIDVPATVDFFNKSYQLQLTVDGKALSPPDDFTAVPYALVAGTATAVLDASITTSKIADGAVVTVKLPDGAVTDAKIAPVAGIAPSKIALSGAATLADWRNPADQTKIDPNAVTGKALVSTSAVTQVIQPTSNVPPLLVKGMPGGASSVTLFEVWDSQSPSQKRFHVRADGETYVNGKLGVGTSPTTDKLEVAGRIRDLTGYVAPVGAIIMFGGTNSMTPPAGWLLCDGTAVSRATYSDLFSVIGTKFGPGDGGSTFNLPDMRGIFPKGAGTTNRAAGKDASGNFYTGTLGTYSTDQMQGHVHYSGVSTDDGSAVYGGTSNNIPGAATDRDQHVGGAPASTQPIASAPKTDSTNGPPRTGHTTEPQSLGLNFIIKY